MSADRIDLNLLRVFDAIFEDRNLALAGKRLNLSQSAISHALGRMRQMLGDDLFVRTGKGMEPTVRAVGMAAQVRGALAQIRAALGVDAFDPRVAQRKFVVAANDYITLLVLGRLSQRLRAEAPLVDLVIRPSTRLDLAGQIDVGRIDVAIGIFADVPTRLRSAQLWEQTDVVLLHRDHPVAGRADPSITRDDLLAYPLVAVSQGGEEEGAVSGFIVERGLARQSEMFNRDALNRAFADGTDVPRMRMSVAHSLAIPALLRHSDMLALVPSSLGRELERYGELKMCATPYECHNAAVRAVWHERNDTDPALQWLRHQLADVARQVRSC
ncbi:LysR family transcriptional regulator [Paraburkholderia sp. PGU19]|uniref:LysR substrate-binding domain-containing protein n=1 Tax=Paraburkholderia sp. PGU19 TaxID=2735434 RepID=UPI0015D985CE|nr:LysR substrate-binding domain-containing protein [Paraburkholderia sp. PGU19]BCG00306.1 LysR family transcriptional regulator [Paraburkholderia sp. PGU19]